MMSDSHLQLASSRPRLPNLVFGTAAVYIGAAILLIAACETFGGGGLGALPRIWHVNRTLWIGIGVLLIPIGIAVQSHRSQQPDRWRASRPGRRFRQILVYSKEGCHLCDEAIELLGDPQYASYLPPIEEVDILEDAALQARFALQIPVVECDGRVRFRGRVNEVLLRRLIEGTPPLSDE